MIDPESEPQNDDDAIWDDVDSPDSNTSSSGNPPNERLDSSQQDVAAVGEDEPNEVHPFFWLVVGLHLLVVLLNFFPLLFYFQRSWQLEHYQFFPIALIIFGYIFKERIDWGQLVCKKWVPIVCSIFLLGAFFAFVTSTYAYNHYLPSVGTFLVLGSLLCCLQDKETEGSLLPLWLLLVPLIRIPLNFDVTLISELQFFSAAFASNVLDVIGIANFTPGTVIQVVEQGQEAGVKKFDVERACSGVQSLYTLIFCTLTVAVWLRRSIIAGILLVLSGVFWSIVMNGVRIVICVAAYYWFDIDVYSGLRHEILGYVILLSAIGLIASTDALIAFIISPIQVGSESRNILAWCWNRLVAGVNRFQHQHHTVELTAGARKIIVILVVAGVGLVNVASGALFVNSMLNNEFVGIVRVDELGITTDDVPERIEGGQVSVDDAGSPIYRTWTLVDESMENETRNANSTYGPYSTGWVYRQRPENEEIQVSLDYTFLGWHELKVCYRAQGWKVDRVVLTDDEWNPVELYLYRDTGEKGYCIFSIFDHQGESLQPLSDNLGFFWLRLKNRINRELSTTTTFQIQCMIQGFNEIPKSRIEGTRELHMKLREEARELVLRKLADR